MTKLKQGKIGVGSKGTVDELYPSPYATGGGYPHAAQNSAPYSPYQESNGVKCPHCNYPIIDVRRVETCPHCGSDNLEGASLPG